MLKTFCWRLVRRAIATGQRAGGLSNKISKLCSTCNEPESDSHLFFHCTFARAVWFSANPPIRSSTLLIEQDGIQEALQLLITNFTSEEQIATLLTTMWYIWRARNDCRFNRKKWTVWQGHQATAAELEVAHLVDFDRMDANTPPLQQVNSIPQGMTISSAGTQIQASEVTPTNRAPLESAQPDTPNYILWLPALLQGIRCYSDTAIEPDSQSTAHKSTGIGVFIFNSTQKIFLQAKADNIQSVLMAETTALLFAAKVTSLLQLQGVNFLIDNQQLASFLNSTDLSSPPEWRIKRLTQLFINLTAGSSTKVNR